MDAKVDLIDCTGMYSEDPSWFAARLLAFTKSTRLQMDPAGFQKFLDMPLPALEEELKYMVSTLPSSWEFVDATFCIRNVSRACAQQITRTRFTPMEADIFGSYAMQAQRVVDVSNAGFYVPDSIPPGPSREFYTSCLTGQVTDYKEAMSDHGIKAEDARGLLPMHIHCNLVVKFNLRSLAELLRKRESLRVQGEYVEVCRQMRELLEAQWPWVAPFFQAKNKTACDVIEEVAREIEATGNVELMKKLAKASDLVKGL
jgi:thymidylate synthase ThyX